MQLYLFVEFSICVCATFNPSSPQSHAEHTGCRRYSFQGSVIRLSVCGSYRSSWPDSHLDPRCYWRAIFLLFLPVSHFSFTPFLNLISIFSHSLPSAISLDLSLPPSVLYGKTFLVFYSAPVKPGAYFQCPKLIANVRKDPSSHSPPPPPHHHLLPFWH